MTLAFNTTSFRLCCKSLMVQAQRWRYGSEKKPYIIRYGYTDIVYRRGFLPREKDAKPIPYFPTYRPLDRWSEKEALAGQNDYIDILGDGNVHPSRLQLQVPPWLRGFKGNEMQRLIRKKKYMGSYLQQFYPKRFLDMDKRLRYLYHYLNFKTKHRR